MQYRTNRRLSWTRSALILAGLGLVLGSCDFAVDSITGPTWQPDVLAPVAKASLEIGDLDQLAIFEASEYVTAANLGLLPGAIPDGAAARTGVSIGPYAFDWLDDIVGLDAGDATVRLKIKNELPIGLQEGALLIVRQASTGEDILTYPFSDDLTAFGRMADSAFFRDVDFFSGLELWVENMTITLEQGEVIEPGMGMLVEAQVELRNIRRVDVAAGASLEFSDTTALEIDLIDDLTDLDISGEFRLKVGNGFPFGGRLTAIFLAEDGVTVLESLTDDPIEIPIPATDAQGFALETAEITIAVPVDKRRLDMLQLAEFVGFNAEAFAPESPAILTANNTRRFDLQLIADFTFTIQP